MHENTQKDKDDSILRQLAELETLSTQDLRVKWETLYGSHPPRFNRKFLIKRLAYRIQEIAYGGLDEVTRKRMDGLLDDEGYNKLGCKVRKPIRQAIERSIIPGTLLVRYFQEERHEVIVREKNTYEYRGKPYRSLSAIARAITGTRWNGPAFFGLRSKKAAGQER